MPGVSLISNTGSNIQLFRGGKKLTLIRNCDKVLKFLSGISKGKKLVFPLVSHPLYVDWCLVSNFTVNFHLVENVEHSGRERVEKDVMFNFDL